MLTTVFLLSTTKSFVNFSPKKKPTRSSGVGHGSGGSGAVGPCGRQGKNAEGGAAARWQVREDLHE